MNVYIYQAALYCEDCGLDIRMRLDTTDKRPDDPEDEYTYDSDEYPKGPYPDGGGESDSPAHCDSCQLFLENPLTSDGEQYVRETVDENSKPLVQEWAQYYSYLFDKEAE